MEQIPDTGGGLFGFLAHYLWMVYRYFPSSGQYDWLLLFIVLALIVNFLVLPHLWNTIKGDINILIEGRLETQGQDIMVNLWDLFCLIFLLFFFNSNAGRTFLADRYFFELIKPVEFNLAVFLISLAIILFSMITTSNYLDRFRTELEKSGATSSQPYLDRNLLSLYQGGGIYVGANGDPQPISGLLFVPIFVIFCAHVFYWNWSVASLVLMHCFILSAAVYEIIRMGFVYIQHKKAFG